MAATREVAALAVVMAVVAREMARAVAYQEVTMAAMVEVMREVEIVVVVTEASG